MTVRAGREQGGGTPQELEQKKGRQRTFEQVFCTVLRGCLEIRRENLQETAIVLLPGTRGLWRSSAEGLNQRPGNWRRFRSADSDRELACISIGDD